MSITAVADWTAKPLRSFVDDSQVQLALLLNTSGQVLAQHGFARSVDVMAACALAAAIHATAGELGRNIDGRPFHGSHIVGSRKQIFLAPTTNKQGTQILCAVFESQTSIGLVRLYFEELHNALLAAAPEPAAEGSVSAEDFERELNRNLAVLFGRA